MGQSYAIKDNKAVYRPTSALDSFDIGPYMRLRSIMQRVRNPTTNDQNNQTTYSGSKEIRELPPPEYALFRRYEEENSRSSIGPKDREPSKMYEQPRGTTYDAPTPGKQLRFNSTNNKRETNPDRLDLKNTKIPYGQLYQYDPKKLASYLKENVKKLYQKMLDTINSTKVLFYVQPKKEEMPVVYNSGEPNLEERLPKNSVSNLADYKTSRPNLYRRKPVEYNPRRPSSIDELVA